MYDPQTDGPPPPLDTAAPAIDQLTNTIEWLQWIDWTNVLVPQWLLDQFALVYAALAPSATPLALADLSTIINQLQACAANNAPAGALVIPLYVIVSEISLGPSTTNPADIDAIGQLGNAILLQEPDWGDRLWMNWDNPSTTLTIQVRDLYTLTMIIAEIPWSTHWDNWTDAATDVVLQLNGNYALPQMAAGVPMGNLFNLDGPCIPSG